MLTAKRHLLTRLLAGLIFNAPFRAKRNVNAFYFYLHVFSTSDCHWSHKIVTDSNKLCAWTIIVYRFRCIWKNCLAGAIRSWNTHIYPIDCGMASVHRYVFYIRGSYVSRILPYCFSVLPSYFLSMHSIKAIIIESALKKVGDVSTNAIPQLLGYKVVIKYYI